ncbi:GtrA family protein [Marinobacteraceae bacterium S3BR75-40.1]
MRLTTAVFQPLRFLLSGGAATLLHWGLMGLLIGFGMPAVAATGWGAFAGALANYLLQRQVVFRSSQPHRQALPSYGLCVALGWLANLLCFALLHQTLGLLSPWAQGLTTAAVAVLNYGLYKRFVFHDRFPASESA